MRANFLRKTWIMTYSAYRIIIMCLQSIWFNWRGKPEIVDYKLHTGSAVLLQKVAANVVIHGQENLVLDKNEQYIIMCNHSSHYDIPLTYMAFCGAPITMVAKKELFRIPLFGRAILAHGTISVDRKNRSKAIKNLEGAKKSLANGRLIWLAPEGTRTKTHTQQLKKGGFILAIESGAKIIPVHITGADKILPAKTWDFNLNQQVVVKIMPHIDTSEYSKDTLDDLMQQLKQSWQQAQV